MWKIGDEVEWNGSCDPWMKAMYRGRIIKLCDGYALIQHTDGYNARSGVAFRRLHKIEGV